MMDEQRYRPPTKEDQEIMSRCAQRQDHAPDIVTITNPNTGGTVNVRASIRRKNNMRNKPCICGSGRKFKHCHWSDF